jgi:3-deoxy-D-arabino-heptulosonate 7-phosphate (DAHP) synthase
LKKDYFHFLSWGSTAMTKTKNSKSHLVLRTVKKETNFTVVEVGLRKPTKARCEKCGKKLKGMSDCPDCGKTLCNDCAGWTVFFSKIICAECVIRKEAHNG